MRIWPSSSARVLPSSHDLMLYKFSSCVQVTMVIRTYLQWASAHVVTMLIIILFFSGLCYQNAYAVTTLTIRHAIPSFLAVPCCTSPVSRLVHGKQSDYLDYTCVFVTGRSNCNRKIQSHQFHAAVH